MLSSNRIAVATGQETSARQVAKKRLSATRSFSYQFFVDAPNLDMTLGRQILRRKPQGKERPRWDQALRNLKSLHTLTKSTLVLNGDRCGENAYPYWRLMRDFFCSVETPLSKDFADKENHDPVDGFIITQLRYIQRRLSQNHAEGIMLASHDQHFADPLKCILDAGGPVVIIGYYEWMSPKLMALVADGARFMDLEHDVKAFYYPLPGRLRSS